jgi:hypothetical protein
VNGLGKRLPGLMPGRRRRNDRLGQSRGHEAGPTARPATRHARPRSGSPSWSWRTAAGLPNGSPPPKNLGHRRRSIPGRARDFQRERPAWREASQSGRLGTAGDVGRHHAPCRADAVRPVPRSRPDPPQRLPEPPRVPGGPTARPSKAGCAAPADRGCRPRRPRPINATTRPPIAPGYPVGPLVSAVQVT